MMNTTPPDENSFADGIVQIGAYKASSPEKKEFLPWHRPRKQFVRHYQWCTQIDRMLQEAPRADGILKYLVALSTRDLSRPSDFRDIQASNPL